MPRPRTIKGADYDSVFRAFGDVLADEGYLMKKQDKNGGQIVGSIEASDPFSGAREMRFLLGGGDSLNSTHEYRTHEGYEVSVKIDPVTESQMRVRMAIQQVQFFNNGGRRGSVIVNEESYDALIDKVKRKLREEAGGDA